MNAVVPASYPMTNCGDREAQLLRQIARLTEERDAAIDELAELRAVFGLSPDKYQIALGGLGLTASQARIVSLLLNRDMATNEQLRFAIFQDATARAERCDNNIKVQISKARQRLAQFGVQIDVVWGHGYRLTIESKSKLREIIAAAKYRPDQITI
jgi:DNA-binding response OmpR family regulator